MTTSAEPTTRDRVRAEVEQLVDEYLHAHPEVVATYAAALPEAPPAPAIPEQADAAAEVAQDEDEIDLDISSLFEEDDDKLLEQVIVDALDEVDDEDLGLAALFAEEDEAADDEDDSTGIDASEAMEILLRGPTEDEEAMLAEAGIEFVEVDD